MRAISVCVFLLLGVLSYGQVNRIPDVFISSLKEDFVQEKDNLVEDTDSKKDQKSKNEFVLKSTYHLKDILQGGKVTFDDPITIYLNKVLDTLMDQNNINENIQIFMIRSSNVNAFATDHGVIFMTTGLIAKCRNEAEIAFVIGHEVTHYLYKHNMNSYIETIRIDKTTNKISVRSINKGLLAKSNYSVSNEYQADSNSVELVLNSDYDKQSCVSALELLQRASLPIERLKEFEPIDLGMNLDSTILELFSLPEIEYDEPKDIKYPTHPKIVDRIATIQKKLEGKGGEIFINSKESFDSISGYAKIELCNTLLQEMYFEEAFYVANNLPEELNEAKANLKAKALYGVLKLKQSDYYDEFSIDIKTCDPNLRSYSHFFSSIDTTMLRSVLLNFIDINCTSEIDVYRDQLNGYLPVPKFENNGMIIIDPKIMKYDFRKKEKKLYIESEDSEEWYVDLLKESFEAAQVKNTILDMSKLSPSDVETFKEINLLQSFIDYNNMNQYYDLDLLPMNYSDLELVFEKYNTSVVGTCYSKYARYRSGLFKYGHVTGVLIMAGFSLASLPYMTGAFTYKAQMYTNRMMFFDAYDSRGGYNKEHTVSLFNPTKAAYKSSLYYLIDQYKNED